MPNLVLTRRRGESLYFFPRPKNGSRKSPLDTNCFCATHLTEIDEKNHILNGLIRYSTKPESTRPFTLMAQARMELDCSQIFPNGQPRSIEPPDDPIAYITATSIGQQTRLRIEAANEIIITRASPEKFCCGFHQITILDIAPDVELTACHVCGKVYVLKERDMIQARRVMIPDWGFREVAVLGHLQSNLSDVVAVKREISAKHFRRHDARFRRFRQVIKHHIEQVA